MRDNEERKGRDVRKTERRMRFKNATITVLLSPHFYLIPTSLLASNATIASTTTITVFATVTATATASQTLPS